MTAEYASDRALSRQRRRLGEPPDRRAQQLYGLQTGAPLSLANITATDNSYSGIYASAPLTLTNVTVTGNSSYDYGYGGIYAGGRLVLAELDRQPEL